MSKQSQYDYNSDSERRTRRRAALIKLLAMLTFALTLWIFASAAWFSMNKNVDTSGMSVGVNGSDFELADKDSARNFFNQMRQKFIDWNYSLWNSDKFKKAEKDIETHYASANGKVRDDVKAMLKDGK